MTIGEVTLADYDAIVARDGRSDDLEARRRVAGALLDKGRALAGLGRHDEAFACFDDVIARVDGAKEVPLKRMLLRTYYNKGYELGELGRSAEAAVLGELQARFAKTQEPELRFDVAFALVERARALQALARLTGPTPSRTT